METSNQVIDKVLVAATDYVESCVQTYIEWYNNMSDKLAAKGKSLPELTEYDVDSYRLEIKHSMIKAMSNYVLNTDEFVKVTFDMGAKGVEIVLQIKRNGVVEYLVTDVIVAHGEIQCKHYRYIVKTNLNKLGVDLTKRLRGIDKAQADVNDWLKYVNRLKEELVTLENTTRETITAEEYRWFTQRGMDAPTWDRINPQAQQIYGTEEAYLKTFTDSIDAKMKALPKEISWKKQSIKKEMAMLEKKQAKLEALRASKN